MSILSRSSELKHPLRNSKKPSSDLMSNKGLSYVREKIRTPDLLVRSQTLYPAELRAHIIFVCLSYLCTSATKLIIAQRFLSVNNFFKLFYVFHLQYHFTSFKSGYFTGFQTNISISAFQSVFRDTNAKRLIKII